MKFQNSILINFERTDGRTDKPIMFEAASYNNFRDILMISFQCPNLQKAIARKKKYLFF